MTPASADWCASGTASSSLNPPTPRRRLDGHEAGRDEIGNERDRQPVLRLRRSGKIRNRTHTTQRQPNWLVRGEVRENPEAVLSQGCSNLLVLTRPGMVGVVQARKTRLDPERFMAGPAEICGLGPRVEDAAMQASGDA